MAEGEPLFFGILLFWIVLVILGIASNLFPGWVPSH
jgi:hypothetical protein